MCRRLKMRLEMQTPLGPGDFGGLWPPSGKTHQQQEKGVDEILKVWEGRRGVETVIF